MLGLTECMDAELAGAFERAGYDPSLGKAVVSNRPDLCEYQCNGAMAGAKTYKKAPFMIAEDVKKELRSMRPSWRPSSGKWTRMTVLVRKRRKIRRPSSWITADRMWRSLFM